MAFSGVRPTHGLRLVPSCGDSNPLSSTRSLRETQPLLVLSAPLKEVNFPSEGVNLSALYAPAQALASPGEGEIVPPQFWVYVVILKGAGKSTLA